MDVLERLLTDLADPAAYPAADWADLAPGARRVEIVQTHISAVFLTALRAYKVKKPLALWGLVDYATPEARLHCCEEEVRLNRRLSDDLYLGVVPIVERRGRLVVGGSGGRGGEPEAVEHAVAMRRFRPEDTLERRVVAGTADADLLLALGRRLAAFHASQRLTGPAREALSPRLHAGVLTQNMRATRAFVPERFPEALHRAVERRLTAGLWRLRGAMRRRILEGLAVDGHGDVRLEHVLVEAGRLSVIDTVEFTTRLRHIDPLSDAAFLWMDLLSRARPDLAAAFLTGYGAPRPAEEPLLWHYAAYRAHVRAKVDATTAAETEVPAAQRERAAARARGHLALAWSLARRGAVSAPLVVLRGPSGSGKSVLASALAPWLDAEVVRSDLVRKELFGLRPLERPGEASKGEVYGPAASERTYAEVLRRGLAAVSAGRAALLDATYLLERARRPVLEAAARAGIPCVIVDLEIAPEVARERLRARALRADDASDADVAVYEEQRRTAEPLGGAELGHRVPHVAGAEPSALLLDLCVAVERLGPCAPFQHPNGRPHGP